VSASAFEHDLLGTPLVDLAKFDFLNFVARSDALYYLTSQPSSSPLSVSLFHPRPGTIRHDYKGSVGIFTCPVMLGVLAHEKDLAPVHEYQGGLSSPTPIARRLLRKMCRSASTQNPHIPSNCNIGVKIYLVKPSPLRRVAGKARQTMPSPNQTPAPPSSSSARLLVADDHDLLRESMRSMLESEPDLVVVDEAKDGQEAIELSRLHSPDLVVMDVRMPRVNGFEATLKIKEERGATRVLIVSTYDSVGFFSEAMRVGAEGYILKVAPLKEILEAIRGALEGEPQYP
jgi:CheY-like chemotaxis protein